MLEKLSTRAVESAREHPFFQALEREIELRARDLTEKLVGHAASAGGSERYACQLGARVAELQNVLRMMREAGSAADE